MLASLSPRPGDDPQVVVLTPGIYDLAYFEHSYLARKTGAELVERGDLVVSSDDVAYMKTIAGLARVNVIYSRVNADYLDPEVFEKTSMLGVPGLIRAWSARSSGRSSGPTRRTRAHRSGSTSSPGWRG